VIVSGTTVAVGLLSMIVLPLPFIRSIGIGGMLIPAVSVITAITLLPALLATLGTRINRIRLLPKRLVDRGHPEDGLWGRWASLVIRRPVPVAVVGLAIVAALVYSGAQLNPSEAQAKDFPGRGDAITGRDALTAAGISAGVLKPFVILGEHVHPSAVPTILRQLNATPDISGAAAPAAWRRGDNVLVEAFPSQDAAAKPVRSTITQLQKEILPVVEQLPRVTSTSPRAQLSLGGVAPEDRDFVHAVYGKFPYVLAFVILLTFVLLMRAFRSVILPLKAVILNLVSLGAAFGIIVFIFQMGHGAEAIWNVQPTNAIISWIPLMIFAFLYGLSMDYEVFMLTRMREAYDETGKTPAAVSLGLARTGKLVTSAALVLMFAFFVLSSSPGTDVKQFGIGLAAGIIFDATVIRALLVPSIVLLIGRWNWWLPAPAARALFTRPSSPAPELPSPEAA
jgi:RND superfamily putative drug exporter